MPRPAPFNFSIVPPTIGDPNFAPEAQTVWGELPSAFTYMESMADFLQTDFATELANGTAALPSMAFATDLDTGFYRVAADQIGASTGGARRWLLSGTAFQLDVPMTGTAVQASITDTTVGRLMKVGAFGLGQTAIDAEPTGDLNLVPAAGLYGADSGTANRPGNTGNWIIIHLPRTATSAAQIAVSRNPTGASAILGLYYRASASGVWGAWRQIYQQDTILGTVSQSAGVPTGAVIERSSNANGEYVRFADGTQICTQVVSASNLGITDWTFPATFLSAAGTMLSMIPSTSVALSPALQTLTTTVAGFSVYNTSSNRVSVAVRITAIGRWF